MWIQRSIQILNSSPAHRTAFVKDVQAGVERDGIYFGRFDAEDMHDLVSGRALVLEKVLDHSQQCDVGQSNAKFLTKLSAKRGLCRFAELDASADRSMKDLAFHPVCTV